jgi:hypothetical protein
VMRAAAPASAPVLPMRVGHGFDLHRLAEGYKLIIGGIDIPHTKGCEAHSDGRAQFSKAWVSHDASDQKSTHVKYVGSAFKYLRCLSPLAVKKLRRIDFFLLTFYLLFYRVSSKGLVMRSECKHIPNLSVSSHCYFTITMPLQGMSSCTQSRMHC